MVLYTQTEFAVRREVFEISVAKDYSKKAILAQPWEAIRDLTGDYIEASKSFQKSPILAILMLARSQDKDKFFIEFLDPIDFKMIKLDKSVSEFWLTYSDEDKIMLKLLPYS